MDGSDDVDDIWAEIGRQIYNGFSTVENLLSY